MHIKGIVEEDSISYKELSMLILNSSKYSNSISSDESLIKVKDIDISKEEICEKYLKNNNTKAIIFSGMEPFDNEIDLISFIDCLRRKYNCNDIIIIYTNYSEADLENGTRCFNTSAEVEKNIYSTLKSYENIIIKFGMPLKNSTTRTDDILGVEVSSYNQYAIKVS